MARPTSCSWDEEFIINEYAKHIFQENVLILFEILQVDIKMIERLEKEGYADSSGPKDEGEDGRPETAGSAKTTVSKTGPATWGSGA